MGSDKSSNPQQLLVQKKSKYQQRKIKGGITKHCPIPAPNLS